MPKNVCADAGLITQTYNLRMTKKERDGFIFRLCQNYFSSKHIKFKETKDPKCDTAKTVPDKHGKPIAIEIRSDHLFAGEKRDGDGSEPILADFDIVNLISAVYHEQQHCIQYLDLTCKRSNAGKYDKRLMSSIVGTKMNPAFYDWSYDFLPHERDAEGEALKNTYRYLREYGRDNGIPQETIDDIMVKFVNDRHVLRPGYPFRRNDNKDFESVDEILQCVRDIPRDRLQFSHAAEKGEYCSECHMDSENPGSPKFADVALSAMYVRKDIFQAYRRLDRLDDILGLFSAINFEMGYCSLQDWPSLQVQLPDFGIPKFSMRDRFAVQKHYAPTGS